jgi:DNA-directed RNA polymerase alpha subunit
VISPNPSIPNSKRAKADAPDIPQKARVAIAEAVVRGDALANLELLGLPVRTINMLEYSRYQITKLEDLLNCRREDLLEIPNFGRGSLQQIFECLARYDQLETAPRYPQ